MNFIIESALWSDISKGQNFSHKKHSFYLKFSLKYIIIKRKAEENRKNKSKRGMISMKKKLLGIYLTVICIMIAALSSCSGELAQSKLCENIWESNVGFLQFTESGKILNNFESEEESVSYYKLLTGGKINMYTEEGEEYGIILPYRFEGDSLYIGEVEYTPYVEEDAVQSADGASEPEDYPDVSYENEEKVA